MISQGGWGALEEKHPNFELSGASAEAERPRHPCFRVRPATHGCIESRQLRLTLLVSVIPDLWNHLLSLSDTDFVDVCYRGLYYRSIDQILSISIRN
ncbi:hypothetical protein [Rubinisphaera sp.]|uniref:hypothetical protein n=1 Tax=Rubinisphaera sp. TaxID=2024857 RepID=UPI0025F22E6E|nr:hypothetical protein [Rubinisphaera sp.]